MFASHVYGCTNIISLSLFLSQKHSSGSLVIKVEPGHQEMAGITELFVRAHFDYNPRTDRLIPSQDAGMNFRKGDILKILNQEDSFWWQAVHHGDRSVAGLVPSQMLEERWVWLYYVCYTLKNVIYMLLCHAIYTYFTYIACRIILYFITSLSLAGERPSTISMASLMSVVLVRRSQRGR